ncbi:MAG: hypothetical protein HYU49_00925 [Candidatus Levybacteria bacterium]|nr:hypothetical protein [Candidatus Levybacteria bacterium]
MLEIIPGILEKDWSEIERKIELVRPFAKTIHIDILDRKFAPNTTFLDPLPFAKYTLPSSGQAFPSSGQAPFFELHMMVEEPIQYLKPFADAGLLAIDGPTPLSAIQVPYDDLDCVLVMTIKAGFSGQVFMPEHLEKVKALRQAQGKQFPIEVDGGINDGIIIQARSAGATRFVSTSFLFASQNPHERYQALNSHLKNF